MNHSQKDRNGSGLQVFVGLPQTSSSSSPGSSSTALGKPATMVMPPSSQSHVGYPQQAYPAHPSVHFPSSYQYSQTRFPSGTFPATTSASTAYAPSGTVHFPASGVSRYPPGYNPTSHIVYPRLAPSTAASQVHFPVMSYAGNHSVYTFAQSPLYYHSRLTPHGATPPTPVLFETTRNDNKSKTAPHAAHLHQPKTYLHTPVFSHSPKGFAPSDSTFPAAYGTQPSTSTFNDDTPSMTGTSAVTGTRRRKSRQPRRVIDDTVVDPLTESPNQQEKLARQDQDQDQERHQKYSIELPFSDLSPTTKTVRPNNTQRKTNEHVAAPDSQVASANRSAKVTAKPKSKAGLVYRISQKKANSSRSHIPSAVQPTDDDQFDIEVGDAMPESRNTNDGQGEGNQNDNDAEMQVQDDLEGEDNVLDDGSDDSWSLMLPIKPKRGRKSRKPFSHIRQQRSGVLGGKRSALSRPSGLAREAVSPDVGDPKAQAEPRAGDVAVESAANSDPVRKRRGRKNGADITYVPMATDQESPVSSHDNSPTVQIETLSTATNSPLVDAELSDDASHAVSPAFLANGAAESTAAEGKPSRGRGRPKGRRTRKSSWPTETKWRICNIPHHTLPQVIEEPESPVSFSFSKMEQGDERAECVWAPPPVDSDIDLQRIQEFVDKVAPSYEIQGYRQEVVYKTLMDCGYDFERTMEALEHIPTQIKDWRPPESDHWYGDKFESFKPMLSSKTRPDRIAQLMGDDVTARDVMDYYYKIKKTDRGDAARGRFLVRPRFFPVREGSLLEEMRTTCDVLRRAKVGEYPVGERGVRLVGAAIRPVFPAHDTTVLADGQKSVRRTIGGLPSSSKMPAKRGRGRPRKHPLPVVAGAPVKDVPAPSPVVQDEGLEVGEEVTKRSGRLSPHATTPQPETQPAGTEPFAGLEPAQEVVPLGSVKKDAEEKKPKNSGKQTTSGELLEAGSRGKVRVRSKKSTPKSDIESTEEASEMPKEHEQKEVQKEGQKATVPESPPELYKVEKILRKRRIGKQVRYLVKWEGYDDKYNTWEPVEHFADLSVIDDFEKEQAELKQRRKSGAKGKAKAGRDTDSTDQDFQSSPSVLDTTVDDEEGADPLLSLDEKSPKRRSVASKPSSELKRSSSDARQQQQDLDDSGEKDGEPMSKKKRVTPTRTLPGK
eukprot:m.80935 g.80935  ORF g.80935 m.80935 type:complete len:1167 (+) comp14228_c0_seq2:320-3820(+)